MTEGATEALLESTLIDEPVESTTIEELESTVRTEAAGVVAEDVAEERVPESMMTCRIQNPDIPRAGRYGAAPGGTAGPGGDGEHRTPTTAVREGESKLFNP